MSAPVCPRCGSIHAANHPTGERPCVPRRRPHIGLVLIAVYLAFVALYFGAQLGRLWFG